VGAGVGAGVLAGAGRGAAGVVVRGDGVVSVRVGGEATGAVVGVEAVVVASDVAVAGVASATGAAAGTASVEAGREVAGATEAAGATGARLTHHTPAAATARTATAPPAIRGMRLVFRTARARVWVIGVEIGDVPATASTGRDALACGWSDAGTGVFCAATGVSAVAAAA
jgi:hypothetical protein